MQVHGFAWPRRVQSLGPNLTLASEHFLEMCARAHSRHTIPLWHDLSARGSALRELAMDRFRLTLSVTAQSECGLAGVTSVYTWLACRLPYRAARSGLVELGETDRSGLGFGRCLDFDASVH